MKGERPKKKEEKKEVEIGERAKEEEGGRREEGGVRREEGGGRKEEGGRRKEEVESRKKKTWLLSVGIEATALRKPV